MREVTDIRVEQTVWPKSVFFGGPAKCYAWLERSNGHWHFLTSLFAEAEEATRRWADKQRALDELGQEGWEVVGAYPRMPWDPLPPGQEPRGYGLVRTER